MTAAVQSGQSTPADRLRSAHSRLAERCRAAATPAEFFDDFLAEAAAALDADAGAVWLVEGRELRRQAAHRWPEREPASCLDMVRAVVAEGVGRAVDVGPDPTRPAGSDGRLRRALLYPIRLGTTVCGVVGLGIAADAPRDAAHAMQRALVSLCDRAAEFCFRQTAQASDARDVARFALEIHASLDLNRTAAAIANELRRMLAVDRVGVTVDRGGRFEAVAVSGQDYLDRRSNLVRRLESLAQTCAATGQTVIAPDDVATLAPQVAAALSDYSDVGHARRFVVVPLADPATPGRTIGVLTAEWIAGDRDADKTGGKRTKGSLPSPHFRPQDHGSEPATTAPSASDSAAAAVRQLEALAPHAARALTNALRHADTPLVGRVAGAAASLLRLRGVRKRWLLVGTAAAVAAILALVPCDFTIEARGTLQPVVRRDMFAPLDGTVEKVHVAHGSRVQIGDPLFELRSTELDVAEADLIKQMNETEQEYSNAQRLYSDGRSLSPVDAARLVGQMATLEQRRESLRRQAALLAEKRAKLRVVSPLAGQVTTWNVAELLAERPVRQGQTLLGLVDPEGAWELEIRLPEDRFGHVAGVQAETNRPPEVSFVLATDPGREYDGTIGEMRLTAEPRGDEGNVVLAKATVDKSRLAQLHPGADVRVQIHCGTRSLGYVLFHDVWSFVQTNVLFRL